MNNKIAIVGAGFSGSVIAEQLASAGFVIDVFESRSHLAGNCHTYREPDTEVMLHAYGPHIFHTSNLRVWEYIGQFDNFMPFTNRVKAIYKNRVYPLPINLLTINTFFEQCLDPEGARKFISNLSDNTIVEPSNFEEQALKFVGRELYDAFFKGYTSKQWGIDPKRLPASILKRLPLRFNYDDNYYNSVYQGMPKNGYTYIVGKMLNHPSINVHLSTTFDKANSHNYRHVFYSGPIDSWFKYTHGRLSYRTLDFVSENHIGDYQGNAVVNYCEENIPWTRISEHKHFSPWEQHDSTTIFKEYSRECGEDDVPYYPVRLVDDKQILEKYVQLANQESNVTFVGRLGTYRYLDMHVTIEEALNTADVFKGHFEYGTQMPAFTVDPLL